MTNAVDFTWAIEFYSGAAWVALTADVFNTQPIRMQHGIMSADFAQRVASAGSLKFFMNNGKSNSGGKLGYYAPDHADVRADFDLEALVRLKITGNGNTRYPFRGWIKDIEPLPGQFGDRKTAVMATDYIDLLASSQLERAAVQIGKRPDQIIDALLALAPIAAQNEVIGVAQGTFPYALHAEEDERAKLLQPIVRTCKSGFHFFYVKGNGTDGETVVFETAQERAVKMTSSVTLTDTMTGLRLKRSRDNKRNYIKTTVHPTSVDTSDVVLCSLRNEIQLAPGEELDDLEMYFRDPNGDTRISAYSVVTPVVADTDFKASSTSGSGNDLNASLTATPTAGANSVKWYLKNNAAVVMYIWLLQLRGKGMYLYDPQSRLADNVGAAIRKEVYYDLPYEADTNVAQDVSDEVLTMQENAFTAVESVVFDAQASTTLMDAALTLDVGSRITIEETASGISNDYFIQHVTMNIVQRSLQVTWIVVPAGLSAPWILGDAVYSVLNSTTYLRIGIGG
jgi:hypothetical protein